MVLSTGIEDSEGQAALIMSDAEGNRIRNLKFYEGQAKVAISPDSSKIAFLQQQFLPDTGQYTGILSIFDANSEETREIFVPEGNVIAFFWSPDSQKLAYFMYDIVPGDVLNAPSQPDSQPEGDETQGTVGEAQEQTEALPNAPIGLVRMNVFDLEEEISYPVVFSFYPTAEFASMLLNFDQYNRSTTIWSPDSNNIVLSGTPTIEGDPVILVVASSGTLEPRFLLDGVLAFWSWN
jgi:hypothetical protein